MEEKPGLFQRVLDVLPRVVWALALTVTSVLLLVKVLSGNELKELRVEYLLLAVAVFLVFPYLSKIEAFGVKVEIKRKVEDLAARVNALPDYIIGSEYQDEGDLQLAEESLHRSLELDPRFWPACLSLGEIAQDEGRHDAAIRLYLDVLKIDPTNVYAPNNLADLYLAAPAPLRNPTEALKWAEKALAALPTMASAMYLKGEALNRLGRYNEAATLLQGLLDLDRLPTQRHWVMYELAIGHSQTGTRLAQSDLKDMLFAAVDNGEGKSLMDLLRSEDEQHRFAPVDRPVVKEFATRKHTSVDA
jgi:tetratricopeptide (TPR) repeat protein